jgi:hypothetical protein
MYKAMPRMARLERQKKYVSPHLPSEHSRQQPDKMRFKYKEVLSITTTKCGSSKQVFTTNNN